MAEYAKPWLSVDAQIDRLAWHGAEVGERDRAAVLLQPGAQTTQILGQPQPGHDHD